MFWPNRIDDRSQHAKSVKTGEGATWEKYLSIFCVRPPRKLRVARAGMTNRWPVPKMFDGLHGDPRFDALVKRIGIPD
jgi:hypothetical protein